MLSSSMATRTGETSKKPGMKSQNTSRSVTRPFGRRPVYPVAILETAPASGLITTNRSQQDFPTSARICP